MKTLEFTNEELYNLYLSLLGVDNESYIPIKNKVKKALGYPVPFKYDQSYENVAKLMMEAIQYDSGAATLWNPETYPSEWVDAISQAAENFFKANPEYFKEESIERIGIGLGEDSEECDELEGFQKLNQVLNDYFEEL